MDFLRKKSFWVPLLVVTFIAAAFGVMLSKRRAELYRLRAREAQLRSELAAVRRQNARLKQEREALIGSPSYIERVAREDYRFRAPGELLLEWDDLEAQIPKSVRPVLREGLRDRLLGRGHFPWPIPLSVFVVSALAFALTEARARKGRAEPYA